MPIIIPAGLRCLTDKRDRRTGSGTSDSLQKKTQETGFNHFEAREYDPRIMRWMVTDPAGQYWSPYVGMGNNPINGNGSGWEILAGIRKLGW